MLSEKHGVENETVSAGAATEAWLGSIRLSKSALRVVTQAVQSKAPADILLRVHIDANEILVDASGAAAPQQGSSSEYVFRKDGGGWVLGVGTLLLSNWRHRKGLARIHRLLQNPGIPIDVTDLVRDAELSGVELAKNETIEGEILRCQITDDENQEQKKARAKFQFRALPAMTLRKMLPVVERQIETIRGNYDACTNPEERDDLLESLRELREKRGMILNALDSPEAKRSKNAYDAVRKGIFLESIPEIKTRLPAMARHLTDSIIYDSGRYRYVPATDINWILAPSGKKRPEK